jgi:hypothetical protein
MNHSTNLISRTWTKNLTKTLAFPVFLGGGGIELLTKRHKIILILLWYNYKSIYRIMRCDGGKSHAQMAHCTGKSPVRMSHKSIGSRLNIMECARKSHCRSLWWLLDLL